MNMKGTPGVCSVGLLVGRLFLSVIFLIAGLSKFVNFESTSAYMAAKGMTMIPFFLIGGAVVEVIGSLSLIMGFKARWGALLLILFMIPTTLIFHNFWDYEGPQQQQEFIEFLKNLGIIGGLIYAATAGPGRFSIDALCQGPSSCCKP